MTTTDERERARGREAIEAAAVKVEEARRLLAGAKRHFPDRGECAIRGVVDVEIGNLGASSRHLQAVAFAQSQGGAEQIAENANCSVAAAIDPATIERLEMLNVALDVWSEVPGVDAEQAVLDAMPPPPPPAAPSGAEGDKTPRYR